MKVLMTVAFVASMFALVYAAPSDGDKSNHGCGCDQQKACSCEKDKCDCGNAESKCDCGKAECKDGKCECKDGTNCGGDKCDCGSKK
jgi:hypothetical protein